MKVLGVLSGPWRLEGSLHLRAKPDEVRDKGNRVREEANRVRDKPDGVRAEPYEFLEKAADSHRPSDLGTFFTTCRNGKRGIHWYEDAIFREESTDFPDFCHIFKDLQQRCGKKSRVLAVEELWERKAGWKPAPRGGLARSDVHPDPA